MKFGKPHIWRIDDGGRVWLCRRTLGDGLVGHYGFGRTPVLAYKDWKSRDPSSRFDTLKALGSAIGNAH